MFNVIGESKLTDVVFKKQQRISPRLKSLNEIDELIKSSMMFVVKEERRNIIEQLVDNRFDIDKVSFVSLQRKIKEKLWLLWYKGWSLGQQQDVLFSNKEKDVAEFAKNRLSEAAIKLINNYKMDISGLSVDQIADKAANIMAEDDYDLFLDMLPDEDLTPGTMSPDDTVINEINKQNKTIKKKQKKKPQQRATKILEERQRSKDPNAKLDNAKKLEDVIATKTKRNLDKNTNRTNKITALEQQLKDGDLSPTDLKKKKRQLYELRKQQPRELSSGLKKDNQLLQSIREQQRRSVSNEQLAEQLNVDYMLTESDFGRVYLETRLEQISKQFVGEEKKTIDNRMRTVFEINGGGDRNERRSIIQNYFEKESLTYREDLQKSYKQKQDGGLMSVDKEKVFDTIAGERIVRPQPNGNIKKLYDKIENEIYKEEYGSPLVAEQILSNTVGEKSIKLNKEQKIKLNINSNQNVFDRELIERIAKKTDQRDYLSAKVGRVVRTELAAANHLGRLTYIVANDDKGLVRWIVDDEHDKRGVVCDKPINKNDNGVGNARIAHGVGCEGRAQGQSIGIKTALSGIYRTVDVMTQPSLFAPVHPYCFMGETLVTMKDGSKKKIEDVEIGEQVETSTITCQSTDTSVKRISKRLYSGKLIKLTLEDGRTINTTPEHPFWDGHGYRAATLFSEGEAVRVFERLGNGSQIIFGEQILTTTLGNDKDWKRGGYGSQTNTKSNNAASNAEIIPRKRVLFKNTRRKDTTAIRSRKNDGERNCRTIQHFQNHSYVFNALYGDRISFQQRESKNLLGKQSRKEGEAVPVLQRSNDPKFCESKQRSSSSACKRKNVKKQSYERSYVPFKSFQNFHGEYDQRENKTNWTSERKVWSTRGFEWGVFSLILGSKLCESFELSRNKMGIREEDVSINRWELLLTRFLFTEIRLLRRGQRLDDGKVTKQTKSVRQGLSTYQTSCGRREPISSPHERFSAHTELRIIKKEEIEVSDVYVYNVHVTTDEVYLAEGVVVHNCLCSIRPLTNDEMKDVVATPVMSSVGDKLVDALSAIGAGSVTAEALNANIVPFEEKNPNTWGTMQVTAAGTVLAAGLMLLMYNKTISKILSNKLNIKPKDVPKNIVKKEASKAVLKEGLPIPGTKQVDNITPRKSLRLNEKAGTEPLKPLPELQPKQRPIIAIPDRPVVNIPDRPVVNIPDRPVVDIPQQTALPDLGELERDVDVYDFIDDVNKEKIKQLTRSGTEAKQILRLEDYSQQQQRAIINQYNPSVVDIPQNINEAIKQEAIKINEEVNEALLFKQEWLKKNPPPEVEPEVINDFVKRLNLNTPITVGKKGGKKTTLLKRAKELDDKLDNIYREFTNVKTKDKLNVNKETFKELQKITRKLNTLEAARLEYNNDVGRILDITNETPINLSKYYKQVLEDAETLGVDAPVDFLKYIENQYKSDIIRENINDLVNDVFDGGNVRKANEKIKYAFKIKQRGYRSLANPTVKSPLDETLVSATTKDEFLRNVGTKIEELQKGNQKVITTAQIRYLLNKHPKVEADGLKKYITETRRNLIKTEDVDEFDELIKLLTAEQEQIRRAEFRKRYNNTTNFSKLKYNYVSFFKPKRINIYN